MFFGRGILVAVGPIILAKTGRQGTGKHLYIFCAFPGQFGQKVNFWCCDFGFSIKYFLPKSVKSQKITNEYGAEFFMYFLELFLNWLGLGETWQQWCAANHSCVIIHWLCCGALNRKYCSLFFCYIPVLFHEIEKVLLNSFQQE